MLHRPSRLLSILLLSFLAGCAHQAPTELSQDLDTLLSSRADSGATFVARVVSLPDGKELYAHDPDRPVLPASNMKLPVSAAALDLFGPDYEFRTYLAQNGDDLWIIGTGDPATGDPRLAKERRQLPTAIFDAWADALIQKKLTKIPGRLYFYDASFEPQRVHPDWSRSFLTDWYAAPISGLNFNDNCIDVKIIPTTPGQPVKFEVMPATANIKIINQCVTDAEKHAPAISRAPDSDTFTISGTCSRPADLESKPIIDPGAFFADACRTHFKSRGIAIAGPSERASTVPQGLLYKPLAVHSTKLLDILPRVNKNSQNLLAEGLVKLLGRHHEGRLRTIEDELQLPLGSWQGGQYAVQAFLRRYNIDDSQFHLQDGSGLGRDNRLTARLLTDLLVAMNKHPRREVFLNSLSLAGHDGTLSKRLPDLRGRIRAKTGYIGGVRALSGYALTRSGKTLAFSIIYNDIRGAVAPFEELQDQACRILVNSH